MRDFTEIIIVVDASGSMRADREQTLNGLKEFIEEQKKAGENAAVSFYTFSSTYNQVFDGKPIKQMQSDLADKYHCGGMTALNDAVGTAIDVTGDRLAKLLEKDRPNNVVFLVITDGAENMSVEYSTEQVANMIKHQQQKYNWKFIFMGADISTAQATERGIDRSHSLSYMKGKEEVAYRAVSAAVVGTRATGGSLDANWKSMNPEVAEDDAKMNE